MERGIYDLMESIAITKTYPTLEEWLKTRKEVLEDVGLYNEERQKRLYNSHVNRVKAAERLGLID